MKEENAIIDDFTDEDELTSTVEFWKHREVSEVVGLFKRWENDNYGRHAVIQTSGEDELHLPNLTALNGKLAKVETDQKIKVVYVGEKKAEKSGRLYEDFKVFVK